MSESNGADMPNPNITDVQVERVSAASLVVREEDRGDLLRDPAGMAQGWRVAKAFAASQLVPKDFRGKPEDVFVAMTIARQMGEDPLLILQSIYMVNGKAGWSASYLIARAQKAGINIRWRVRHTDRAPYKVRIEEWGEVRGVKVTNEYQVPDVIVTAYATLPRETEPVEVTIGTEQAVAAGWATNKQYTHSCELMLRYRTATQLIRLYAPHILHGYHTSDELEDVDAAERNRQRRPYIDAEMVAADLERHIVDPNSGPPPAQNPPGGGTPASEGGAPASKSTSYDSHADATTLSTIVRSQSAPPTFATAKDLLKGALGLRAMREERWQSALQMAERHALIERRNGCLVALTTTDELDAVGLPPFDRETDMVKIQDYEASIGGTGVAEIATRIGLTLSEAGEPVLDGQSDATLARYLAALRDHELL